MAVLDETSLGVNSWWPYARIIGFLTINIILGAIVYILFRRAGILGNQKVKSEEKPNKSKSSILDAELAD